MLLCLESFTTKIVSSEQVDYIFNHQTAEYGAISGKEERAFHVNARNSVQLFIIIFLWGCFFFAGYLVPKHVQDEDCAKPHNSED